MNTMVRGVRGEGLPWKGLALVIGILSFAWIALSLPPSAVNPSASRPGRMPIGHNQLEQIYGAGPQSHMKQMHHLGAALHQFAVVTAGCGAGKVTFDRALNRVLGAMTRGPIGPDQTVGVSGPQSHMQQMHHLRAALHQFAVATARCGPGRVTIDLALNRVLSAWPPT